MGLDVNSKGTSLIVDASGAPAVLPSIELSPRDAELLRLYKKFLQRYGLREALYCSACFDGQLHDGCEAHVTDGDILIKCRCTTRFFKGQTI